MSRSLHRSTGDDGGNAPKKPRNAELAGNRLASLATVEMQLIMQHLDAQSLLRLARCNKSLLHAADQPFAWKFTELFAAILTAVDVAQLLAGTETSLARHAVIKVVHILRGDRTGTSFADADWTPLLARRVTRLLLAAVPQPSQIEVIRRMQWLIELNVRYPSQLNRAQFDLLLAPGHRLHQLELLDVENILLDSSALQRLAGLPSLKSVVPYRMSPTGWSLLANLPQMTHLTIMTRDVPLPEQMQALNASLATLKHLRDLMIVLRLPYVPAETDVPVVIPPLPMLRRLWIAETLLTSFEFLQHSPNIESITLMGCRGFTNDQFVAALVESWPTHLRRLHTVVSPAFSAGNRALITERMQCPPDVSADKWQKF